MKKIFSIVAAAFVALAMNAAPITVAQAVEEGMKLDSMGVSAEDYTVEGFAFNAGSFSMTYHNQSWYMADAADATASDFQAYNCYPIDGSDTLKVLNGDKMQVTGKLKKYYNKTTQKYIIEIEKGNATFVSKTAGDHTISTVTEAITVAKALEIGATLANNASTEKQYVIKGYVSAINVKSSDAFSSQYGNQSFYVTDTEGSTASSNAEGAFYVYRGKPETGAEIPVGTLVEFTTTIKKYVPTTGDPVIENSDQNIIIKVLGGTTPIEDADVTFTPEDFKDQGQAATLETPGGSVTATKGGVTVSADNAYGHNLALRVYAGAKFTISSTEQIGKIKFQFYSTYTGQLEPEIVVNAKEWSVDSMPKQARIEKIQIYFGTAEEVVIEPITVAEAITVAQALNPAVSTSLTTTETYAVKGFIVGTSSKKANTWYMADEAGAYGEFQAYTCKSVDYEVAEGDLVIVTGKISNYHGTGSNGEYYSYEIANGDLKHVYGQGVENVTLGEKAQKVMVDGVLYIIRDNKLYNLQGAQVR